ncbi:hypothetical protein HFP15_37910 [Amycolatopsis sp. K13G38]|uniref:Uncharacterized protein n=1 Tax=Amycolatopsis acididurans TaxID=2724524 RepID=A0ABX1JFR4_9PSEU|nr:hypothetical protein [Amycolatopsis acididurans]NKQ58635.1 hypothetical protein [Amycolatopsis acididurans]
MFDGVDLEGTGMGAAELAADVRAGLTRSHRNLARSCLDCQTAPSTMPLRFDLPGAYR